MLRPQGPACPRKSTPGRGYSKGQGPEAGKGFLCSWNLRNGVLKADCTLGRGKRIFWNKLDRYPSRGH